MREDMTMRGRLILGLALPLLAAGCGDSSLNPFNWFGGGGTPEPVALLEVPEDPRPLIDQVTAVTIDRTPGGAIVRATGLPAAVGYWNAALVPVNRDGRPDEAGVLALEFRAVPPPSPVPGSPAAREIVAGYFITEQVLRDVRSVSVLAERNRRDARP
jgi:hypothetical protein